MPYSATPAWSYTEDTADDGTHYIRTSGEIDMSCADEFRGVLHERLTAAGDDKAELVVDLSGVTFMDSAALGALIIAYQFAGEVGRGFRIADPARSVRRVLEITGMLDILLHSAQERK